MSFMMTSPSGPAGGGLPQGELLATYSTYAQAREQVDRLAATDFPVSAVSIVGKDLRVVERVRGRLDYGQVALGAALRGLLFGALIGVFLLLLDPSGGWMQVLTSALLGVAVWMIFGVVGFAARKGRHGFASTQSVVPGGYDLVVAFEHAARARQELGLTGRPSGVAAPAPAPAVEDGAPAEPTPAVPTTPVPTQGGSHAAPAPGQGPTDPVDASASAGATAPADAAPTGLDRSYGVSMPPEEVQRLIEARGGRPSPVPGPQDAPRPDPDAPQR